MKRLLIVLAVAVLGLIGTLVLSCVGFMVLGFLFADGESTPRVKPPGEAAFGTANSAISRYEDEAGFGNDPEAVAIARDYSQKMKLATDLFFEGGKQRAVSMTDGVFITYCRKDYKSCVLLVHVPQLRQYKGDVRDGLADVAWAVAQDVAADGGVAPDAELAVGLRGTLLYGPVMVGDMQGPPSQSGLDRDDLYRFFAEEQAADDVAEPEAEVVAEVEPEPQP